MASIGAVILDVQANTANLIQGMTRAQNATRRAVANMQRNLAGLATAFVSYNIIGNFKKTADEIDKVAKVSSKLGLAVEDLMGLQYAAQLSGVKIENLNMSLQRMARRVAEAASGTGEAKKALQELNISAQDLNKLSPDKQLEVLADALKNVTNQSDKVRIAFKLFDSGGVELLNMLKDGSEGLKSFRQEAEQLGLVVSQSTAKKIENLNDSFTRMSAGTKGAMNTIVEATAPAITSMNTFFATGLKSSNFNKNLKTILEGVSITFAYITDIVFGVTKIFADIGTVIGKQIANTVNAIKVLFTNVGIVYENIANGVLKIFDKLGQYASEKINKIIELSKTVKGYIESWGAELYNALNGGGRNYVYEQFKKTQEAIKDVKNEATTLKDVFSGNFADVQFVEGNFTDNLLGDYKEIFKSYTLGIKDLFNSVKGEGLAVTDTIEKINETLEDTSNTLDNGKEKVKTFGEIFRESLTLTETQLKSITNVIGGSLSRSIDNAIDGTFNFRDAVKDMAKDVLKQLIKILVVQKAIAALNSALGVPAAGGATPTVSRFARGGVINSPTSFGGGSGLMGEAGAEVIMPLSRDSSGNLGVSASPVKVEIINNSGGQVSQTQDGDTLRVIIEAVENNIANGLRRGTGEVGNALQTMKTQGRI